MTIQRNKNEIIINVPSFIDVEGVQRIIDLLAYKEATSKSKAKQNEVDLLTNEIKKDWWAKNKSRFIK